MENYNLNEYTGRAMDESVVSLLLQKVYVWMTLALGLSGLTAYLCSSSLAFLQFMFSSQYVFYGIFIAEFAVVMILSACINKLSFFTASLLFILYAVLTGATFSTIFLAFRMQTISMVFFITAGTFLALSLYGHFTKRDLTSMGSIMIVMLIGLIIASVVNIFMKSEMMEWIISYVGVIIFMGLTAYDTQKIKNMISSYGNEVNEGTQKIALLGSLTLYLDFINLFLYMLRIFGGKRD